MYATPLDRKKSPPADSAYALALKRTTPRIGLQSKPDGHSEGRRAWLASMASTTALVMVMRSEALSDRFS